ncbi:acyl-CoA carboxylase epsilon subunit [Phytohabitans houttuyneae]|uniref:acyl-CoA carboxylase epsilon subunit n=1 Tax=Phytohabitans houttuyneae TaxID=1076126 RepID=UPI001566FC0C|nr:acyl-CoA carboxylase epsilon subunit [Phytohabitans houttuyneae]
MSEPEPVIRVTRGVPTAEELAALVGAVLLRRRPAAAQTPAAAASAWARSARPGAGRTGWRGSLS